MESSSGVMPGHFGKFNQTLVTEFILQGFAEHPELRLPLLGCFFFLYTMAFMGNTLIITIITCSSGLHSPMYFFLLNLATMDIICTSSVLPKVLAGLALEGNTISFQGCMSQLFFLALSLSSELLLLTVMAYDRYVAICWPLHYGTLMSLRVCLVLTVAVWAVCALVFSIHTGLMAQLSFCGPNIITHFFCEIPPLLLLSCSPTYINSFMTILTDAFYGCINFLLTLVSYGYIISSILHIRSAEGKWKAFSTCSSHLIVVFIYYSAVFCAYISPASSYRPERNKLAGVLYTTVSPTLNPLIYTLRNKEVKAALGKLFSFCRH
ncbi:olfactory receptor 13A1-like [Choloepus didactylus]|uniref:olfactory receptor 13A1-like n=1 Tax=Choloepus didactylus TaxID=27675 RepID=UPI0018A05E7E|nr:olfactory receptor 13A1-like [Choloepus didactylus]